MINSGEGEKLIQDILEKKVLYFDSDEKELIQAALKEKFAFFNDVFHRYLLFYKSRYDDKTLLFKKEFESNEAVEKLYKKSFKKAVKLDDSLYDRFVKWHFDLSDVQRDEIWPPVSSDAPLDEMSKIQNLIFSAKYIPPDDDNEIRRHLITLKFLLDCWKNLTLSQQLNADLAILKLCCMAENRMMQIEKKNNNQTLSLNLPKMTEKDKRRKAMWEIDREQRDKSPRWEKNKMTERLKTMVVELKDRGFKIPKKRTLQKDLSYLIKNRFIKIVKAD